MRLTMRRIFVYHTTAEKRDAMQFTSAAHRAFESLVRDRPGSDIAYPYYTERMAPLAPQIVIGITTTAPPQSVRKPFRSIKQRLVMICGYVACLSGSNLNHGKTTADPP